ncbi:Enamine deaminase RidA, house cleaning of reactive enamine intermediates, YjgF/YER057c/UK114 family [Lentzea xinjiangensis]|uniref:Enamine deaminase RidA, house cleaning of reactive enamine intermediates, YjgF/YER057c/UK114 family n=1 Tax=Lentzea xinjiangensis TaxID=402600 RepID=A0A1H9M193_9PSEU|nr:RidA family protein [Lentzea xinjiangensis]SER17235.1 Enamine deaminase RidA, house cleaning of reactive enamine intermediates, YjgF/YER057c/UK114 family [Lentzea xinjiangensis]
MITLINPAGLPEVDVYHQVAVATGTKTIYVAGQVAWDAEPDLAVQVEQAYVNVHTALEAAGATFDDLVKVTVYVVDWTPDKMPQLLDGIARAAKRTGRTPVPPATLIGVAALDVPEHLVEIEAVAVTG